MKTLNRRLLATLTPRGKANPLLPPYAHSLPSRDPLQPPYAHSVDQRSATREKGEGLKSPIRFTVLPQTSGPTGVKDKGRETLPEGYRTWAQSMLESAHTREELWSRWKESVGQLASAGASSIPQLPFQELSQHLSTPSTKDTIIQTGSLIVRDVLADQDALAAAKAILAEIEQREGRPVFWHDALLAIRGDPSILSSNNQILSHLLASKGEAWILADTIHEGLPTSTPVASTKPWSSRVVSPASIEAAVYAKFQTTPISASLALTPLRVLVAPTTAAVTYATLAPLIRSKQSKISFYDTPAYLSVSNHRLIDPSELQSTTFHETRMPHLEGVQRMVDLAPGDVLYHAPGMPVMATENAQGVLGLSLHINPVARGEAEGKRMIQSQREAFEAGAPPLHATLGEEAVELEQAGSETRLGGHGARTAMGY